MSTFFHIELIINFKTEIANVLSKNFTTVTAVNEIHVVTFYLYKIIMVFTKRIITSILYGLFPFLVLFENAPTTVIKNVRYKQAFKIHI